MRKVKNMRRISVMKGIRLIVLIASVAMLLLLSSCNLGDFGIGGKPVTPGGGLGEEPENLIYDEDSELYYFISKEMDETLALNIASELDFNRNTVAKLAPLDSEPKAHELVLGKTDRAISQAALTRLARIEKNSKDELIFLVYSDGASVALVWEEDDEGVMEELAVDYFIKNYVKEELILKSGIAYYDSVDLMEEYYAVIDREYKEAAWNKLEAAVGKDLTDAYRQLYALYESKTVVWLANLYDPDICICVDYYGEEECSGSKYCGGSGFYYSNSARDNLGFLPDIESTAQALSLLSSSGMAYKYWNNYSSIVPTEMKEDISRFIIALQEPNGYFYHPQWGVEFTDTKISRRSRDLNSATTILRAFGKQPVYDTPNGVKGSGVVPTVGLSSRICKSSVSMVSRAVMSSDVYASHLQDVESFRAYLDSLDIENDSYFVGNELTSQNNQIIARDKVIGTENDPTPLMDTVIEWLDSHQKENGAWDDKKPGDDGYRSEYYASNGLLKISGIYNAAGRVFPNAEIACQTAISATLCDSDVGSVVELYNTWYAIQVIIGTLRLYGDDADEAIADEIVAGLREIAVEGIKISREKDSVFFKADGSASYGVYQTAAESQGCPVAIAGTNEGDVNATIIALTGIVDHSMAALELSEYKIPIFGEYERMLFYKTINNLSPIIKGGEPTAPDPIDFEDDDIGGESAYLEVIHKGNEGYTKVINDPTESAKGKILEISSVAGAGDYVKIENNTVSGVANMSVFEGDFYVKSSSASYSLQILMENQYMLSFRTEGDQIRIVEVSSGDGRVALEEDLRIPLKMCQWFKLKIEYYYADHDNVRIKVYADTDLSDSEGMKLYAVTDNYYDPQGVKFPDKVGKPYKELHGTSIYCMSGVNIELYVDNLNCYKLRGEYVPATDPDDQPSVNVDSPDRDGVNYGFDDGELPIGFITRGDGYAGVSEGTLKLSGTAGGEGSLSVPITVTKADANCAVASFKIGVSDVIPGQRYLNFTATEGIDKIFGFVLEAKADSLGNYLTLLPVGDGVGETMTNVRIPVGSLTEISFAYYHGEDAVLVYIDGEFVGASDLLYKDGFKRKMKELVISETGTSEFDITLDDVSLNKVVSSFEEAVASDNAEKIFDFEKEDSEVITDGNLNRVKDGDYELRLDSTKTKGSALFPINNRSQLYTAIVAELKVKVTQSKADGVIGYISAEDSEGNAIFTLALCAKGDVVELCQVGVDGVLPYGISSFAKGEETAIRIDAFTEEGVIVIYMNGKAVCISRVYAVEAPAEHIPSALRIKSGEVTAVMSVDDLKAETFYKILGDVKVEDTDNPETDLSEGLDFESSTVNSIPDSIGAKLNSLGSYAEVERLYNDYRNEYSNALVFHTAAGNNDTLSFTSSEDLLGYKGVVFEADIKLDRSIGNPTHRISLTDKSGVAAYMLLLRVNGNEISLIDTSNLDTDIGMEYVVADGIDIDSWFNLRIECYYGKRDTVRFKVIINGETAIVSDNFVGKENSSASPMSSIERVEFFSMQATVADLRFDNVSLSSLDEGCSDKVNASEAQ